MGSNGSCPRKMATILPLPTKGREDIIHRANRDDVGVSYGALHWRYHDAMARWARPCRLRRASCLPLSPVQRPAEHSRASDRLQPPLVPRFGFQRRLPRGVRPQTFVIEEEHTMQRRALGVAVHVGFMLLLVVGIRAEAAALKVLSAIGMQVVMEDLGPKFARATGHTL